MDPAFWFRAGGAWVTGGHGADDAAASRSADPAAAVSEERREVLAALLRLPARQRGGLLPRFSLDLSEADTASAMRISRGAAKSTVARGLAALRQLLGEQS